jgi:hypothetical protein
MKRKSGGLDTRQRAPESTIINTWTLIAIIDPISKRNCGQDSDSHVYSADSGFDTGNMLA